MQATRSRGKIPTLVVSSGSFSLQVADNSPLTPERVDFECKSRETDRRESNRQGQSHRAPFLFTRMLKCTQTQKYGSVFNKF
jgi:hypothetical protein